MAYRFFRSIPDSVPVRDPYEEVFLLFSSEGASSGDAATRGGPWQHNRSVSQTANTLEVELAFTPVPTPPRTPPTMERSLSSGLLTNSIARGGSPTTGSDSRPGSRPGSRAGLRGVAVSNSMAEDSSAFQESVEASNNNNNNNNNQSRLYSPAPMSPSKVGGGGSNTPLFRLGSKRAQKSSSPISSPSLSSSSPSFQTPLQKPLVIHQSLSTLSQPGQTGSVVWDSSILMAKFLLSIRDLQLSHFLFADNAERTQGSFASMQLADGASMEKDAAKKDSEDDLFGDEDDEEEEEEEEEEEDEGWQTRPVFDPRRTSILELGSGCGLLGIVLVEFCRRLLLTDQPAVLPLLLKNLKRNLDKRYFADEPGQGNKSQSSSGVARSNKRDKSSNSGRSGSSSSQKPLCQLQIQELIWGQDLDPDLKRGVGVDFVIATDVVYNESVTTPLVGTLTDLCNIREKARQEGRKADDDADAEGVEGIEGDTTGSFDNSNNRTSETLRPAKLAKTVVLLAQELRTDYVHMSFLEKMKDAGFKMVRMPTSLIDPEFHGGYVIYACWLK